MIWMAFSFIEDNREMVWYTVAFFVIAYLLIQSAMDVLFMLVFAKLNNIMLAIFTGVYLATLVYRWQLPTGMELVGVGLVVLPYLFRRYGKGDVKAMGVMLLSTVFINMRGLNVPLYIIGIVTAMLTFAFVCAIRKVVVRILKKEKTKNRAPFFPHLLLGEIAMVVLGSTMI